MEGFERLIWKDDYKIGNELVDYEHKKLFHIANEAFTDADAKDRKTKIHHVISELFEYMKVHFKDEEEYMQSIGYPHLAEHALIHKELIEEMTKFIKSAKDMNINTIETSLATAMKDWVLVHILEEDFRIGEWVRIKA